MPGEEDELVASLSLWEKRRYPDPGSTSRTTRTNKSLGHVCWGSSQFSSGEELPGESRKHQVSFGHLEERGRVLSAKGRPGTKAWLSRSHGILMAGARLEGLPFGWHVIEFQKHHAAE